MSNIRKTVSTCSEDLRKKKVNQKCCVHCHRSQVLRLKLNQVYNVEKTSKPHCQSVFTDKKKGNVNIHSLENTENVSLNLHSSPRNWVFISLCNWCSVSITETKKYAELTALALLARQKLFSNAAGWCNKMNRIPWMQSVDRQAAVPLSAFSLAKEKCILRHLWRWKPGLGKTIKPRSGLLKLDIQISKSDFKKRSKVQKSW